MPMTSFVRTTTKAGVATVVSVVCLASLAACSAVLGIGDWVDLSDAGSTEAGVGDSGSGDAKGHDASDATSMDGGKDARVDADAGRDATQDASSDADASHHDAFNEATDGVNAILTVMTTSLDFNTGSNGGVGVSCGTTAMPLNVLVMNTGSGGGEVTALTLGLGTASPYTVPSSMLPISVPANTTVPIPIPITPKPILKSSAPGADLNDTLTVTTNVKVGDGGFQTATVSLIETSAGAALSLSSTSPPMSTMIAFSSTPTGTKATDQLSLTNSGNIAVPVVFSSGGNPVFTFDAPVTAPKNANTFPNAYFTPANPQGYQATGSMTVIADAGVPLCSGFDGSIALELSGTGTTSNTYAVVPASIPFGDNTCGAAAPVAKTVTITNDATASTTWTATLSGAENGFFKLSAGSGMISGSGAMATFTVTPNALTSTSGLTAGEIQSGVSTTLTVVVGTGASIETFTIPVSETPLGAFPIWSTSMISMTGNGSMGSVELQNAATAPTSFTFTSSSTSFPVSPGNGNSSAGAPLTLTVTDNALLGSGMASVAVSLTTPAAPLCGPLPGALMVTGNGAL
jgi:hypothetical protein